ncbi:MAG: hypothetical protein J6Y02_01010 [Pseudobutyrivibrio sp.]|nr:hypothetical protein [Pseudobutyrivibrio sp.]
MKKVQKAQKIWAKAQKFKNIWPQKCKKNHTKCKIYLTFWAKIGLKWPFCPLAQIFFLFYIK